MTASNNNGALAICTQDVVRCDHSLFLVCCGAHSCHSFNDEVGLREGAGLIEAADVDLACEGDSEGLSAEDLFLNELDNRVVDCHAQLHWEFWRHHVGNDKDTSEHDLIPGSVRV